MNEFNSTDRSEDNNGLTELKIKAKVYEMANGTNITVFLTDMYDHESLTDEFMKDISDTLKEEGIDGALMYYYALYNRYMHRAFRLENPDHEFSRYQLGQQFKANPHIVRFYSVTLQKIRDGLIKLAHREIHIAESARAESMLKNKEDNGG